MAKIYLACEASTDDHPFAQRDYERMIYYASTDKLGNHDVCNNPEDAEIIVFIGSAKPNFSDIKGSSLYKKHRDKSVVFYSGDRGIPILPGLYACLENKLAIRHRKSVLSCYYLRVTDNTSLDIDENIDDAEYLYSFIGNANNHPVRKKICRFSGERSFLNDSSLDVRQQDDGITGENKDRGLLYRDVLTQSKFVLCPRGVGVSSWRLFETMRAGRVPVIISDDWIPPVGPTWDSFALFVKERDVMGIPKLLEETETEAVILGANARKEWEKWYSEEVVFSTIMDLLLLTHSKALKENKLLAALTYTQYLRPYYLRHWILSPLKQRLKGFWSESK
ncbi:MAG: exostosin family protein [Arenicella sp.]|nr:exostosin family protein [Arenicella sp.]